MAGGITQQDDIKYGKYGTAELAKKPRITMADVIQKRLKDANAWTQDENSRFGGDQYSYRFTFPVSASSLSNPNDEKTLGNKMEQVIAVAQKQMEEAFGVEDRGWSYTTRPNDRGQYFIETNIPISDFSQKVVPNLSQPVAAVTER